MSIPSVKTPSPIQGNHVRPAPQNVNAPANPVFSRKPTAAPTSRAEHVNRPPPTGSTPYGYLAREMCTDAHARYDKLKSQTHPNPSYFGESDGANVFFNKATGEVAVHDLDMKSGLRGLLEALDPNKKTSTCLIKPDGRIFFNGELLTEKHPQARQIIPALAKIGNRIHDEKYGFINHEPSGTPVVPAWDPASPHHEDYVS